MRVKVERRQEKVKDMRRNLAAKAKKPLRLKAAEIFRKRMMPNRTLIAKMQIEKRFTRATGDLIGPEAIDPMAAVVAGAGAHAGAVVADVADHGDHVVVVAEIAGIAKY